MAGLQISCQLSPRYILVVMPRNEHNAILINILCTKLNLPKTNNTNTRSKFSNALQLKDKNLKNKLCQYA